MKAKKIKSLLAITGLLLTFNAQAQTLPPATFNNVKRGELNSLLGVRINQITDLTLTGELNGTDIKTLRGMENLAILNIENVDIVSFGTAYYGTYNTSDNIIGDYMFYKLAKLTAIILPKSVTRIRSNAFRGCTSLTSVTIPESVIAFDDGAFRDCTSLTSVTIPENVFSIVGAFSDCTSLTSVTIPSSVIYIDAAFRGCTSLKSVTIPENVTYIGNSTFNGCTSLISVTIPESVTEIRDFAFSGCTSLKSVTIPESVTSIRNAAFSGCTSLTSVTIPENVTRIDGAFRGCTSLKSVTIPKSVTLIREYAFEDCTRLTEIHSKNPTPPTIGDPYPFGNVNKTTCKLYVPKGSRDAYWWAWGFDNVIEGDATAINTIDKDKIAIHPVSNGIAIETEEATPVSIFNIAGQKVHQSVVTGSAEIHLNKGVYIVRVNNGSRKIIIK